MKLPFLTALSLLSAAASVAAAPAAGIPPVPLVPSEDPFYLGPPGWESTAPGTVLKTRNVTIAFLTTVPIPVDGYQLLYRTSGVYGEPLVTVTTVMVPQGPSPSKLVAYSTPEDSASTQCAPSFLVQARAPTNHQSSLAADQAAFEPFLAQGIIVTMMDHDGPNSSFAAGPLEGKMVLDSVRATLAFGPQIGLLPSARTVLWGYSGGAIATGWAEALQREYAPDLTKNIVGGAHGGTPASLQATTEAINGGSSSGLLISSCYGIASALPYYHESLYSLATDKTKALIADAIATQCVGSANANNLDFFDDAGTYFTSGNKTLQLPAWQAMFAQLEMYNASRIPPFPMHIYHSRNDQIIPYSVGADLVKNWCAGGASLEFVTNTIPQIEHVTEAVYGVAAAIVFLGDRLNGVPFKQQCTMLFDPVVELPTITNSSVIGKGGVPGAIGA
ncbi:hypothetical protein RQP46_006071 [Phenoliferia psychrophenolica]